MVSKQRVMRYKLNTDVNLNLVTCSGSYNHLEGRKISFIYIHPLYMYIALSYEVLYVSSCCRWYLYMLLPSWKCSVSFCLQTVCGSRCKLTSRLRHCSLWLLDDVSARLALCCFFGFCNVFFYFQFCVHGDYPYRPIDTGQTSQKWGFKV